MRLPKGPTPAALEVHAYMQGGEIYKFPARDMNHARQIAGRIVSEYLYIIQSDGSEEFYPPDKVYKAKIVPDGAKVDSKKGHLGAGGHDHLRLPVGLLLQHAQATGEGEPETTHRGLPDAAGRHKHQPDAQQREDEGGHRQDAEDRREGRETDRRRQR